MPAILTFIVLGVAALTAVDYVRAYFDGRAASHRLRAEGRAPTAAAARAREEAWR